MSQSPPSLCTDADLVGNFVRQRSQEAFAQLVARHAGMVLGACRSVLGNTADAEDAAQAVFMTLAQKPPVGHISIAGWLHKVAWYVSARAAEARAIRQRHETEAATMKRQNAVENKSSLELLHASLCKLPEKYRIPLLLHHIEGRTQEETAALLGVSVGTVAMRLSRGRKKLRDRMAGGGQEDAALASVMIPTAIAPPGFITGASHAASLAASGKLASAAMFSGKTYALSKGAINMLYWTKVKFVAAIVAVILFAGGAVGTYVTIARAGNSTTKPAGVPIYFTGVITQAAADSITAQQATTHFPLTMVIAIDTATIIKLDDKDATAAALKPGQSVGAIVPVGKPATEIRAFSPKGLNNPPATTP